jgi:hypothetical protein
VHASGCRRGRERSDGQGQHERPPPGQAPSPPPFGAPDDVRPGVGARPGRGCQSLKERRGAWIELVHSSTSSAMRRNDLMPAASVALTVPVRMPRAVPIAA